MGPYQPPILHAVGACHALHMRMCGSACFHCVLYVTCAVCYAHCTPSVLICHSSQTLVVSCSLPGGGPQAAAYCALPDAEIPLPPTLPAKVLSQAHRSGPRGPPAPSWAWEHLAHSKSPLCFCRSVTKESTSFLYPFSCFRTLSCF